MLVKEKHNCGSELHYLMKIGAAEIEPLMSAYVYGFSSIAGIKRQLPTLTCRRAGNSSMLILQGLQQNQLVTHRWPT